MAILLLRRFAAVPRLREPERYSKGGPCLRKKSFWLLLLPGLLLILVFLILPIARIVLPTFQVEGQLSLSLYQKFLGDSFYLRIFLRTLRVGVVTALISMVLALPVSFYISRQPGSRKGIFIAMATFPLLTNTVVRAFAWITILGREGILNNTLVRLGIVSEPLKLLYTEGAILVGSVYLFLPIMLISLVGVMENISDETLEAAQSLGANRLTTFLRVVVPLSVPGLIVGSVLVFAGASAAYSTPLMLGGNKNMLLSTLIYQQAMTLDNWTRASVIATVMIVTSYLVVGILNQVAARIGEKTT